MCQLGSNRDVGCPDTQGAGRAAVFIAMTTVSFQAAKAALADPVEALRYE